MKNRPNKLLMEIWAGIDDVCEIDLNSVMKKVREL